MKKLLLLAAIGAAGFMSANISDKNKIVLIENMGVER
jgi:hypothetical protein